MLSFTINGLQLIGSGTGYLLQDVTGIDVPPYRVVSYDNPGQDGGTVTADYYGSRPITLTGVVGGGSATPTSYLAARKALASACANQRDANNYPVLIPVAFTTLDGQSFTCKVQVQNVQFAGNRPTRADFKIDLVVPDPMLYGSNQTSGQFGTPVGGGFFVPFYVPVSLGGSSGGNGSIANAGNAPTWPVLTLRGALTNPFIYNVQTGQFIKLTWTTAASDVVVINCQQRTIVLNGSTSLLSTKSTDSQWFQLPVGTTTITLSSGSTSDTGTLEVTAASAYLGI